MKKTSLKKITTLIFIGILFGFFIINLVVPDRKFSAAENRSLQEFPRFNASQYIEGRYMKKLENYANDQFVGRGVFVRIKSALDLSIGKNEANGVYLGHDGYLIEEIKDPDMKRFTAREKALTEFKSSYPNINMYFLLAPNAGNIMREKLPFAAQNADQNKYMDDFFKALRAGGFYTIDVREDFEHAKKDAQLYYRTDHHWTGNGAYIAYKDAVKTMGAGEPIEYSPHLVKNDFKGSLYSKSGFVNGKNDSIWIWLPKDGSGKLDSVIFYPDTKKKTTEFYRLKNLSIKDAYSVFGGTNHPMYKIETPVKSNKRLLVIKDSYANSLVPLLAPHYRSIVVVDPRYYFEDIDDLIESEGITDILFLYNANTLFNDDSLTMALE